MKADVKNRHKCALLIRGALSVQRRKQNELAKKLGLNRVVLNMYLNRKLDLLPEDIERILNELNVNEVAHRLSAPANIDTEALK